jgi:hypothetical protein
VDEETTILNAIRFPDHVTDAPLQSLRPVNNFRFIFNQCFGAGLPYLEPPQVRIAPVGLH